MVHFTVMQPDARNKKVPISLLILGAVMLMACAAFLYAYKKQKETVVALERDAKALQQENIASKEELDELRGKLAQAEDDLSVMQYICNLYPDCETDTSDMLQERLFKHNGFENPKKELTMPQVNFFKFFFDPPPNWTGPYEGIFSDAILSFIKEHCPAKIHEQQELSLSRYRYRINETKTVDVILSDAPVEIACAWTEDSMTGQFERIR